MGGGPTTAALTEVWNEWEVHVAVVASFSLQAFLYLFARIRRYSRSSVVQILLWLGFLLADVVATFAMGQISTWGKYRSSSPQQKMMAFWAPFLLLHLGGQDTINAFSLEDNRLWQRHMLNMSVQVAAAAYVLYKYLVTAAGGHLSHAAGLVFAAGVLRYGERVWALKLASMKEVAPQWIRKRSRGYWVEHWDPYRCHHDRNLGDIQQGVRGFTNFALYRRLVLGAHYMIYWFKPAVLGNLDVNSNAPYGADRLYQWVLCVDDDDVVEDNPRKAEESIYKAIQLELELMYELVYTKAAVIRTWYGLCIRVFCLCAILTALQIFLSSNKREYSTSDIAVSYILLTGAAALEITSALREIGSSWTLWRLNPSIWPRLRFILHAVQFVRYLLARDERWSNSVGQYNLISFCTRDKTKILEKIKETVGRWIGIQASHYSKHVKLSTAVKQLVLRKIKAGHHDNVQPEVAWCSGGLPVKCRDRFEGELLSWSFECSFEESILSWHIATDVFLRSSKPGGAKELEQAQVIATLSDYMMYLLAVHPDMLPVARAEEMQNKVIESLCEKVEGDPDPHGKIRDSIFEVVWSSDHRSMSVEKGATWGIDSALKKALMLGRIFLNDRTLELSTRLEIAASVWVEMLCYAAFNTHENFHARQLSKGGEFLTHVSLLMLHLGKEYSKDPEKLQTYLTQEERNIIKDFRNKSSDGQVPDDVWQSRHPRQVGRDNYLSISMVLQS